MNKHTNWDPKPEVQKLAKNRVFHPEKVQKRL